MDKSFRYQKNGNKKKIFSRTTIFYESPYRIIKTLQMIHDLLGPDRSIVIGRELTKKFEEYIRGNPIQLLEHFKNHEPKGEFVLMIAGYDKK